LRSDIPFNNTSNVQISKYEIDKQVQNVKLELYDILMFKYASRSTSFAYRIERLFPAFRYEWHAARSVRNHLGAIKRTIVHLFQKYRIKYLASPRQEMKLRKRI